MVVSEEDIVYLLVVDNRQQMNARAEKKRKTLSASKSACQPLTTSVVDALYFISVKVHSSSALY